MPPPLKTKGWALLPTPPFSPVQERSQLVYNLLPPGGDLGALCEDLPDLVILACARQTFGSSCCEAATHVVALLLACKAHQLVLLLQQQICLRGEGSCPPTTSVWWGVCMRCQSGARSIGGAQSAVVSAVMCRRGNAAAACEKWRVGLSGLQQASGGGKPFPPEKQMVCDADVSAFGSVMRNEFAAQ